MTVFNANGQKEAKYRWEERHCARDEIVISSGQGLHVSDKMGRIKRVTHHGDFADGIPARWNEDGLRVQHLSGSKAFFDAFFIRRNKLLKQETSRYEP